MAGPVVAVALAVEVPVEVGNWAKKYITPQDVEKIGLAVATAEKKTDGEIVPLIVRRSSTVGHVPMTLTLIFLVLLLVFEIPHNEFFSETQTYWLLLPLAVFCFVLARFLSLFSWVRRWLTPQADQAFQVAERAALEFHQLGVHRTDRKTGILLMLSLMERRVVVYGDEAIAKKLPQEAWNEIRDLMVTGVKAGQAADGMIKAIQRSGELLAQHFPAQAQNKDELSNQLILKE